MARPKSTPKRTLKRNDLPNIMTSARDNRDRVIGLLFARFLRGAHL